MRVGGNVEIGVQTGVVWNVGRAVHTIWLHRQIEVGCGWGRELGELVRHLHVGHAGSSIAHGYAVGREVDLRVTALRRLLDAILGFVLSAPGF